MLIITLLGKLQTLQHAFLAIAATRPSRSLVLLKLASCQFKQQAVSLEFQLKAFNHTVRQYNFGVSLFCIHYHVKYLVSFHRYLTS